MKRLVSIVLVLIMCGVAHSGTITKRLIGKQDMYGWDGVSDTFTATTSTGRTITLDRVDWVGIDVDGVQGSQTGTSIQSVISAVGAVNEVAVWLSPGTWNLSANITTTSNITLVVPPGAEIVLGAYDLVLAGPLVCHDLQTFDQSGAGTLTLPSMSYIEHDSWDDGTQGYLNVRIVGVVKANFDTAANAITTHVTVNSHKDADGDTQIQVEEAADEDIVRVDVAGDEKAYIGEDATASYIQVNSLMDEDADTQVQVEESADEDIVRVDVAGDEKLYIGEDATASYIQVGGLHDEDADTKIQVEEGADDDTIRFDVAGTEVMTLDGAGAIKSLATTNGPVGTFTCAAAATTTITNTSVTASSIIFLQPTNAAAATLMAGASSLYISARNAGVSFVVGTADAGNPGSTETFNYLILN